MLISSDLWILHLVIIIGGILFIFGLISFLASKIPLIGPHFDVDEKVQARAKASKPGLHTALKPMKFIFGLGFLFVIGNIGIQFFTEGITVRDVKFERGNLTADELLGFKDADLFGLPGLLGGSVYEDFTSEDEALEGGRSLVINSTGFPIYVSEAIYGIGVPIPKERQIKPLEMVDFGSIGFFGIGCQSNFPDKLNVSGGKKNAKAIRITERPSRDCDGKDKTDIGAKTTQQPSAITIATKNPGNMTQTRTPTQVSQQASQQRSLDSCDELFLEQSQEHLQNCAEQGNDQALFVLGVKLFEGHGVAANRAEALRIFHFLAEEKNHSRAQADLAFLYALGEGVPRNFDKAMELGLASARQGDPVGLLNVGIFHRERAINGSGGEGDLTTALALFLLAGAKGNPNAEPAYADLTRKIFEENKGRAYEIFRNSNGSAYNFWLNFNSLGMNRQILSQTITTAANKYAPPFVRSPSVLVRGGAVVEVSGMKAGHWRRGNCPESQFSSRCGYMVYRGMFHTSNSQDNGFSIWMGKAADTGELVVSVNSGLPNMEIKQNGPVRGDRASAIFHRIETRDCRWFEPNNNFPNGNLTCTFRGNQARQILNAINAGESGQFSISYFGAESKIINFKSWHLGNFWWMFDTIIGPKL